MDTFASVDFTLDDDAATRQRGSYRTQLPGLAARVLGSREAVWPLADISRSGCGLLADGMPYGEGLHMALQLELHGRSVIAGMEARVVRVRGGLTACAFCKLTPEQECALDKLVLEIQKRDIRRDSGRDGGREPGADDAGPDAAPAEQD